MAPSRVGTHAERRTATVEAVLAATVTALAQDGYAATTTRSVAARAGVSLGALQHYFPTRAALVEAAISRVFKEILTATRAGMGVAHSPRERVEFLLDRLWEVHTLPVAAAFLELINAARTDKDLAVQVDRLACQGMEALEELAVTALSAHVDGAKARELAQLAVTMVRGTVTLAHLPRAAERGPDWTRLRAVLLGAFESALTG